MTEPTPHDEDRPDGRRARILVAEDNPINQEVIVEQLSLLGLQAEVADDGQIAFERWQQHRHDLLLTDLQMPQLDGYQLARAIRAEEARLGGPRTAILALTARAAPEEQQRCLQAGMDGHLPKPLDLSVLRARLSAWLPAAAPQPRPAAQPRPEPADTAPAAPDAAPLLDPDALSQYVGDDPATLAHFRTDFRQRLGPMQASMAAAAARDDLAELGSLAHQLKSTSRTVGALRLAAGCEDLEHAARAGLKPDTARHWPRVVSALTDTDRALGQLLQDGPAPG